MGHPCPATYESAIHYNTRHTDPGSGADAPPQIRSRGRDIPVGSYRSSLDIRVLPRGSGCSRLVPNAHGTQPPPEDRAIRSVSVPNKIARCTIPGKRLDDLARNPLRGRICRHPERYPQSTSVTQNHKAIEQPERYRRQHEEVDCRDTIDMIGQEGPPALRWRPPPVHIACDR